MEYDRARFLLRHPEAVVCERHIVAVVKSYDSSKAEPTVVGYHVAEFGDGLMRRHVDSQSYSLYEDACFKVREWGRSSIKGSLSRLGKEREDLIQVVSVPYGVGDGGTLEKDQERLKVVRETISRLEEELDKLKA